MKSGRDFNDGDTLDRPFVAVVNEALARKSFPNQNPLGRTIFCPFDSFKGMTIIGVVGDVRQRGPEREPMAECYMPYGQHGFNGATLSLVTRTAGDPRALSETVRRVAREWSTDVPMKFTTMEATLRERGCAPIPHAVVCGFRGACGVSCHGGRLRRDGVCGGPTVERDRPANGLGASTGSVLRLVLGQGLRLTGLGLVLGLVGSFAGTRLLTTMLFEVKPNDPLVYLAVWYCSGSSAWLPAIFRRDAHPGSIRWPQFDRNRPARQRRREQIRPKDIPNDGKYPAAKGAPDFPRGVAYSKIKSVDV